MNLSILLLLIITILKILHTFQYQLFYALKAKTNNNKFLNKIRIKSLNTFNTLIEKKINTMNNSTFKTISDNQIVLSEIESEIFKIVLDSLSFNNKNTIARVAGGWVRDKLLNRDSDDIDIAVDNQSGVEFAKGINEYLKSSGLASTTVAVIQANPEQSKHLETANIKILDRFIDCVNLRSETYTDDSRIPDITYGTALEDALRRDFTINSLFYNLNTKQIEDFTGQGFDDLKNGIIRTPLDPLTTFTDDPLRVLRAIRFASRLNYKMTDELVTTASLQTIHTSLINKISRERVYKELLGMFNRAGHPILADVLMYRLNLLDAILVLNYSIDNIAIQNLINGQLVYNIINQNTSPSHILLHNRWKEISIETSGWLTVILSIQQLNQWNITSSLSTISKSDLLSINGGANSKIYIAALCSGFIQLGIKDKKNKISALSPTVLKDSLKADMEIMKFVEMIHESIPIIFTYAKTHCNPSSEHIITFREQAGLLIRQTKEYWHQALYLACAYELAITAIYITETTRESNTFIPHNTIDRNNINENIYLPDIHLKPWMLEIINRYISLESFWVNLGLNTVYEIKPLLDGNQLISTIPFVKKGPQVGKVLEEQIKWQLRNPNGSIDEVIKYLTEYVKNI